MAEVVYSDSSHHDQEDAGSEHTRSKMDKKERETNKKIALKYDLKDYQGIFSESDDYKLEKQDNIKTFQKIYNHPLEVGILLRIDEISYISTSDQKYCIKGVYQKDWLSTENDKLNFQKYMDGTIESYEPEYEPRISWVNCVEYPAYNTIIWTSTKCKYRLLVGTDGRLYNQTRSDILSIWTEEFNVKSFPFDVQDLTMVFVSEDCGMDKIRIRESITGRKSLTLDRTWSSITSFAIDNVDIKYEEVDYYKKQRAQDTYVYGRYRIQVKRRWLGLFNRIILWMFILGLLSWTAFGIKYESVDARMSFVITMVLTVIAFQFIISNELPHVGYLTFLDKYNLFIFVYVAMICLESVIIGWHGVGLNIGCKEYDNDDDECRLFYSEHIDNICAVVFGVLYVVGNVIFAVYAMISIGRENGKLKHWHKYNVDTIAYSKKTS